MASSTTQYKPAMLIARLTDLELVGKVDKKRDYFVVVHIDDEGVAKSKGRYGLAPLRWQDDPRIEFHPSSTIKLSLFRHSIFPLRRPYEIGRHECSVTKLLENNNVTTRLDLAEDGRASLAGLNVKISLITDPAGDIIQRVDADLARLKGNNLIASASGKIDNATAIAQVGGQAVKLLGSCVEPLGQALQLFVKVMDGVADAHPFVKVGWTIISTVYKTVQAQIGQDATVFNLAELLREMVGVAAEIPDLLKVKGTTDVIEEISRASVEISTLIDEYTRHSFIGRMTRFQILDAMTARIGQCESKCRDLIEKFDRRVGMGTNKKVTQLDATVQEGFKMLKDDALAKDISKWLNAPESSRNYNDARKKHQASTGSWFMDSESFSEWKNSGQLLCLYGKAGCGKTILCSSIIADVVDMCMKKESSACAYFFFDGRDAQSALQRHDGFIRSLIQQFVDKCDGIPAPLVDLYGKGHQQPSTEALENTLEQIRRGFSESYIIIDSLDECIERRELLKWINKIAASTTGNLHLLATTRPEEDIKASLRPLEPASITIEEGVVTRDIEAYIDSKIKEGRLGSWPEEVRMKIKDTLMVKAEGMFRWLAMQLEELQECFDVVEIEDQLERLPKDLDETYSRVLMRIPEQRRASAKIFLQWTAFSARPPSLEELCESAAFEFDQDDLPKYNPRRRFQIQDVLATCASLIIESDGYAKLSHFTVKEYLLSERITSGAARYFGINEKLSHMFMAETSLAYLQSRFDSCGSLEDGTVRVAPLAQYAASKWVFHVQSGGGESVRDIRKRIVILLESASPFTMWIRLGNPDDRSPESRAPRPAEPLYYASLLGFTGVSRQLLDNGADVNTPGVYWDNGQEKRLHMSYGNALQAACHGGHAEMVNLLLERGADVNVQGGYYGCALQAAAFNCDETTVKSLLEKGADVNASGGVHLSAILAAVWNGNKETVKLLLDRGANFTTVTTQGECYSGPLQVAALKGDEAIVKLLTERGVDRNMQVEVYSRALQKAASRGQKATAQLLLEMGADVNAEVGEDGSVLFSALSGQHWGLAKSLIERADFNLEGVRGSVTPLQSASLAGNLAIVQLLLDRGADVTSRGGFYGNSLQAAVVGEHEAIVKLLMERGVGRNMSAEDYSRALEHAIHYGNRAIVQLLLDMGADVNAEGEDGSVLLAALKEEQWDIAKLLIERADFNLEGGEYVTPLQAAAFTGNLAIVKLLLDLGAEVNTRVALFGSPLQAASFQGHTEIVKLLLQNHADVNAQGGMGGHALMLASIQGEVDVVKLLLENHADVNAPARDWVDLLDDPPDGKTAMQTLHEKQADADAQGEYTHALQAASHKGHTKIVSMLLDGGADVNARGGNHGNALRAALEGNHDDIAKILLEHGATPLPDLQQKND